MSFCFWVNRPNLSGVLLAVVEGVEKHGADDKQTLNHILHIGGYAGKGHDVVDNSEEDDTHKGTPRGSESSARLAPPMITDAITSISQPRPKV